MPSKTNDTQGQGQVHEPVLGTGTASKFVPVSTKEIPSILKVLEDRLPRSGNVYYIALYVSRNVGPDCEILLYTLNGDTSSSAAWIVAFQDEKGLHVKQTISISAPVNPEMTDELKQAFASTLPIRWDESYMFNAVDREVKPLIMEISSVLKQNPTKCFPNYYYTISREDALNLEIEYTDDIEVKALDLVHGASFITNSWKYSIDGTLNYVKRKLEQYPSVGIYSNASDSERPVSAALTHSDLLVGMLTTDPGHRNKGYALICMKTLLKNLAREGYVPSSCVEQHNEVSIKFHLKCGMKFSHECDFIKYSI